MGSQVTVTLYAEENEVAEAAVRSVFAEFDRLDRLLSVWHKGSEVSRINAMAGSEAVRVVPEVLTLIERSLALSKMTHGKFDISFGGLSGLWKFDHDRDNRIPSAKDIAARLPLVGYENIVVDRLAGTVSLKQRGMRVHLGGVGKGYAVDRAVARLREQGFTDFMIQAGGDLYVAGSKGGRPWRVGVRDPRGSASDYFAALELSDETFSTSGDYERSFVKDGKRYHHIIDPDTGRPAEACRSATVLAKDALTADALSTAIFILGPKRGFQIIDAMPGIGAVLVDRENKVHVSRSLGPRLKILRQPRNETPASALPEP